MKTLTLHKYTLLHYDSPGSKPNQRSSMCFPKGKNDLHQEAPVQSTVFHEHKYRAEPSDAREAGPTQ